MFTNVAQRLNYFQKILQTFPRRRQMLFCVFYCRAAIKHTHHAYLSGSLCAPRELRVSCRFIAFSIICVVGVERDAPNAKLRTFQINLKINGIV